MPFFEADANTFADYIEEAHSRAPGWWSNFDKYIVSLLKAYYGDAATKENDLGFDWLPRVTGDHSHLRLLARHGGRQDGRPCSSWARIRRWARPNSRLERTALSKLKWLVVRDMVEIETRVVLVRLARSRARRIEDRRHRNRSVSLPGRGARGKRRLLHQYAAPAAVPRESGRTAGRCPQRDLVHVSPWPPAEGESAKRSAAAQCRAQRAHLGLFTRRARTANPDVEEILQEINGCTT